MRDIKNRPEYLSQWTNKELVDGASRPQVMRGFSLGTIVAELKRRRARHDELIASNRRNQPARQANLDLIRDRCGMLSLEQWKLRLGDLVQATANLRGPNYQACMRSIQRGRECFHARTRPKGPAPCLEAIWILGFWAFLIETGGIDKADAGLAKLLDKIEECRAARVASKHYNFR